MLQWLMVLDEHGDSPVKVRAPVADPQRRQGRNGLTRPPEADEVRRIVLGRRQHRGPIVGQVVLTQLQLASQPPEQG